MASLEVGMLFPSYEELKIKIDEYQRHNHVQLVTIGSETVEVAKKKFPQRPINPALIYNVIRFACSDCLKNKNWFKSIDVKFDIEMYIRLAATKDGKYLEVRKISEKHSHPVGKVSKLPSSTTTRKRKENSMSMPVVDVKVEPDLDTDSRSPGSKRKRKSLPDSINLGKQAERWKSLKGRLNVNSDEEFAEILLNQLEKDFNIVKPSEVNSVRGLSVLSRNQLGLPAAVRVSELVSGYSEDIVNIKEESENDRVTCSRNNQNNTSYQYGCTSLPSFAQTYSNNYGKTSSDATLKLVSNTYNLKDVIISRDEDETIQASATCPAVPNSLNGIGGNKNSKVETELCQAMNKSDHQLHMNNIPSSQVCMPTLLGKDEEVLPQVTTTHYYPSQPYETISPHKEVRSLHECWNKICQEAQLGGDSSAFMLPTINIGTQFDRWRYLKQKLQIDSDEHLAKFLIDRGLGQ